MVATVSDVLRKRERLGEKVLNRAQPDFQVSYEETIPGFNPLTVIRAHGRSELHSVISTD